MHNFLRLGEIRRALCIVPMNITNGIVSSWKEFSRNFQEIYSSSMDGASPSPILICFDFFPPPPPGENGRREKQKRFRFSSQNRSQPDSHCFLVLLLISSKEESPEANSTTNRRPYKWVLWTRLLKAALASLKALNSTKAKPLQSTG